MAIWNVKASNGRILMRVEAHKVNAGAQASPVRVSYFMDQSGEIVALVALDLGMSVVREDSDKQE